MENRVDEYLAARQEWVKYGKPEGPRLDHLVKLFRNLSAKEQREVARRMVNT